MANAAWVITTAVGTGERGFGGDGGPAERALLNGPFDVGFDADGNLYFSDTFNHRIRRVDVRTGVITRGSKVRFLRDGVILWKGQITSLKRFKDDVREVREGFECGIGLSNNQDLQGGDIIETYDEREIPRT